MPSYGYLDSIQSLARRRYNIVVIGNVFTVTSRVARQQLNSLPSTDNVLDIVHTSGHPVR